MLWQTKEGKEEGGLELEGVRGSCLTSLLVFCLSGALPGFSPHSVGPRGHSNLVLGPLRQERSPPFEPFRSVALSPSSEMGSRTPDYPGAEVQGYPSVRRPLPLGLLRSVGAHSIVRLKRTHPGGSGAFDSGVPWDIFHRSILWIAGSFTPTRVLLVARPDTPLPDVCPGQTKCL